MTAQPAFSPSSPPHVHASAETCPYCQQEIPNERVAEIRQRYEADRQKQERDLTARVNAQVSQLRIQIDEAKRAEITALSQQHAAAIEKHQADAIVVQNAAREEGKKLADTDLQRRIDALIAAQAASMERARELEEKRTEAVNELANYKAQQETTIKARTDEVRIAMEAQKLEDINAINAKNAAGAKALNEKIAALQKLVDAEEAEGADIKILSS